MVRSHSLRFAAFTGTLACLCAILLFCVRAAYATEDQPADTALCTTIAERYQSLLTAHPDAPYRQGFYADSPLGTLVDNPESGVTLARPIIKNPKNPSVLTDWAKRQKPPVTFAGPLRTELAALRTDGIFSFDRLPNTHIYAFSAIGGTALCYSSVIFAVKAGHAERTQPPLSWDDEAGGACGINRGFGKVDKTPFAFEGNVNQDYSPALLSSLSVSGWDGKNFGPACTVTFKFAPRLGPQGTLNTWPQSCAAANCEALRQAALHLVEMVQNDPAGVEAKLVAQLTPAQSSSFLAMRKDAGLTEPETVSADPSDLLDSKPLALPLVVGDQLYLARIGHFTIGWRSYADWSVKIEARKDGKISPVAALALGMTMGRLVKVQVK